MALSMLSLLRFEARVILMQHALGGTVESDFDGPMKRDDGLVDDREPTVMIISISLVTRHMPIWLTRISKFDYLARNAHS